MASNTQLIPSMLTFFTKNQERYKMIAKKKHSTLNTIVGVTICVLLGVFVLTKAPDAIAQQSLITDKLISLSLDEIEMPLAMSIISEAVGVEFIGIEQLKDNKVTLELSIVPPVYVVDLFLKCLGFGYIEHDKDNAIEIVPTGEYLPTSDCKGIRSNNS
jgi:hypothetical protein